MNLYKINDKLKNHILTKNDVNAFFIVCEKNDNQVLAEQFFTFLKEMKQQFLFEDVELNPKEDWIFLSKQAAELTVEMWCKFWGEQFNKKEDFEILDVTPKL